MSATEEREEDPGQVVLTMFGFTAKSMGNLLAQVGYGQALPFSVVDAFRRDLDLFEGRVAAVLGVSLEHLRRSYPYLRREHLYPQRRGSRLWRRALDALLSVRQLWRRGA